jgi:hypothetical protein
MTTVTEMLTNNPQLWLSRDVVPFEVGMIYTANGSGDLAGVEVAFLGIRNRGTPALQFKVQFMDDWIYDVDNYQPHELNIDALSARMPTEKESKYIVRSFEKMLQNGLES